MIPHQRWLRIIPVALLMYMIAYVDRTNISMALPSVSRELRIDSAQAGNVVGVFPAMGLINSVGNLGGFFGAIAVGYLNKHMGGFRYGFGLIGLDLLVGASLSLALNSPRLVALIGRIRFSEPPRICGHLLRDVSSTSPLELESCARRSDSVPCSTTRRRRAPRFLRNSCRA